MQYKNVIVSDNVLSKIGDHILSFQIVVKWFLCCDDYRDNQQNVVACFAGLADFSSLEGSRRDEDNAVEISKILDLERSNVLYTTLFLKRLKNIKTQFCFIANVINYDGNISINIDHSTYASKTKVIHSNNTCIIKIIKK